MTTEYSRYNADDYIHFKVVVDEKGNEISKTVVPYEEIEKYSLDAFGNQSPNSLVNDDFTIVDNYLLKYWSSIMGVEAVSTFLFLKMHSFGKDYTYVKITEIAKMMGKTTMSVRKYINKLEEFGFVTTFRRLKKDNNNKETSPYFKLRRSTPLLSKEQVEILDKHLQEEHEKYLNKYNSKVSSFDKVETLSHRDVLEDILANGSALVTFESKIRRILESENMIEFIRGSSPIEKAQNEKIHDILQSKMSRPSYESWFHTSMFYSENRMLKIIAKTNYERDWIQNQYIQFLEEWLKDIIEFEEISIMSFEEIVRAKYKKRKKE